MNDPNTNGEKLKALEKAESLVDRAQKLVDEFNHLTDAILKYMILGNAGGVFATLGVIGTLVSKNALITPAVGPLTCFVLGVITGGLTLVTFGSRSAVKLEDHLRTLVEQLVKAGGRADTMLADWELEGMRRWNRLGGLFAVTSQVMFVAGAVWGLIAISNIK